MTGPKAGHVVRGSTQRPVYGVVPFEIEWCPDGPPLTNGGANLSYQHAAIAAMLRSKPGVWAKLPSLPLHYANAISGGINTAYRPGGSFEAVVRNGVVYARRIE